jgi:uncharacterized protein (DUF58 family)
VRLTSTAALAVPLTRRGVAVGAAAVVLYAAGLMWGYPVLRALAGVAGAVIVVAVIRTVVPLRASVVRELYPQRVDCGKPALATLVVRNATGTRQPGFIVRDVIDGQNHEVPVRGLPAGGVATYRYALPTARRGRVVVGPLTLRRGDALGLARRDLRVGGQEVLWVHPRRHPARAATGARAKHHHEGPLPRLPLPGSMEQRAVREYVPGDELRHLHWRATARAQRLMVRDYVDPAQPRCVVLLDTRPAALSPDAFEHAVEVAASVTHAAVTHGHPTRLCTTAGLDINVERNPDASRVLLDALCEVEQREVEQSPAGDRASLGELTGSLRSGGWLVLVTGDGERDLVGAMVAVRRHYAPFVIFDLGERGTLEVPGVTVVRSSSAADAVRQWNSLVAR